VGLPKYYEGTTNDADADDHTGDNNNSTRNRDSDDEFEDEQDQAVPTAQEISSKCRTEKLYTICSMLECRIVDCT